MSNKITEKIKEAEGQLGRPLTAVVLYPMIFSVPFFFLAGFMWGNSMIAHVNLKILGSVLYRGLLTASSGFVARLPRKRLSEILSHRDSDGKAYFRQTSIKSYILNFFYFSYFI